MGANRTLDLEQEEIIRGALTSYYDVLMHSGKVDVAKKVRHILDLLLQAELVIIHIG